VPRSSGGETGVVALKDKRLQQEQDQNDFESMYKSELKSEFYIRKSGKMQDELDGKSEFLDIWQGAANLERFLTMK
jgi:hypothetical protein